MEIATAQVESMRPVNRETLEFRPLPRKLRAMRRLPQNLLRWSGILFLAVVGVACRSNCPILLTPAQRDVIQIRTATVYESVVLFKPEQSGAELPLAVRLAPLLIQQIEATNSVRLRPDRFLPADTTPRVACREGITLLNNRWYRQFSYTWNYPTGAGVGNASQGVRITLNAHDEPAIWEILHDTSGAQIIYVAQSLERAARAEFGPPPPGRKFAVERNCAETRTAVVANVIEDGPVVMGPILYLRAGNRDVTALICRCMSAQFHELCGQQDYRLAQITDPTRAAEFNATSLDKLLRLPAGF